MDIEAIVKKHLKRDGWSFSRDGECAEAIRAALTEAESCMAMEHNLKMLQVEAAHAIELRAYEATVENLEERIRELEAVLVYIRSVLPMDKWADDSRRMIDAAIAAEGEKK